MRRIFGEMGRTLSYLSLAKSYLTMAVIPSQYTHPCKTARAIFVQPHGPKRRSREAVRAGSRGEWGAVPNSFL